MAVSFKDNLHLKHFILAADVLLLAGPPVAQKLVDPDKVAPNFARPQKSVGPNKSRSASAP